MNYSLPWLDRLERRFGRYAVPNLTLALIAGQALVYFAMRLEGRADIIANLQLVPSLVKTGQIWRLVTFAFEPPMMGPLFAFIFWYLFYMMGTALEQQWGLFRYNLFLLIGFVATAAVSFLTPNLPASNGFLQGSVFLAFAFLFPDFVLHLFFVLPIKIKWLALLAWLFYLQTAVMGTWHVRLQVIASVANFLVFFGRELVDRLRHKQRRAVRDARESRAKKRPLHECRVCGITNLSHPKMQFRYCTKCAGQCGYCTEHLHDHEHVTEATAGGRGE